MTPICCNYACGKRIDRNVMYVTCTNCGNTFHFTNECCDLVIEKTENAKKIQFAMFDTNPEGACYKCPRCRGVNVPLLVKNLSREFVNVKEKVNEMNKELGNLKSNNNAMAEKFVEVKESWATVISRNNPIASENISASTPSVVIKPKKKENTRDDIRNSLNRKLKINEFDVVDSRAAKNNGLIFKCMNVVEQKRLYEEVSKALGDEYDVKCPKELRPRIKIANVVLPDDIDTADKVKICEYLKNENIELMTAKNVEVVLLYKRKKNDNVNDHRLDIIMEVDGETHKFYMSGRKMKIGWALMPVYDGVHIKRCFKCLGFGHKKADCKKTESVCAKCGGNHLAKDCNSATVECCNCKKVNLREKKEVYSTNHRAMDNNCPMLQLQKDRISSIINFN